MNSIANDILEFWFGDAVRDERALKDAFKRWFSGGAQFDEKVRERFASEVETALEGGFIDWEDNVRPRLALILLLDQFPRNIFRRTPRAFAGDARALQLAQQSVASRDDRALSLVERVFLLMPYQHAEDLEVQRAGVALFEALADEPASESVQGLLQSSLDYARKHREIIEQFGRFPYRNEALGRESTATELEWMSGGGQRFGQ